MERRKTPTHKLMFPCKLKISSRTSLLVVHSTESPRSHEYSSPPSSSNSKPSTNVEEFLHCLRNFDLDACSQIVMGIVSFPVPCHGNEVRLGMRSEGSCSQTPLQIQTTGRLMFWQQICLVLYSFTHCTSPK